MAAVIWLLLTVKILHGFNNKESQLLLGYCVFIMPRKPLSTYASRRLTIVFYRGVNFNSYPIYIMLNVRPKDWKDRI